MDWVLLVPLELASNAVEMKGFSNMEDYKTAFADKGVIGSVLEFAGSTYIVYRVVDELADRHKNHKSDRHESENQEPTDPSGEPTTPEPPEPPTPPVEEIPVSSDVEIFYYPIDGVFFITP